MFKFLKDKLKSTITKISEDIDKEGKEEVVEQVEEPVEETKPVEKKPSEEPKEEQTEKKEEDKGFFAKLKEKFSGHEEEKPAEPEVKEEAKPVPDAAKEEEKLVEKEEPVPEPEPKETTAEEPLKEEPEEEPKESVWDKLEKPDEELKKESEQDEAVEEPVKEIQEEAKPIVVEEPAPMPEPRPTPAREATPAVAKAETPSEEKFFTEEEPQKETEQKPEEAAPEEEAKGMFAKLKQKIVTKKIDEEQFDKLFWELELALLENNVAVEVIDKIKQDLKGSLVDKPIRRSQISDTIMNSLKLSIEDLFTVAPIDLMERIRVKKPFVICFFGVNGSGKTTTIAKIVQLLKDNNLSCCLAAADTFRAAAIDQLQQHADALDVKMIKHDYGSDPAAVAFDAVKYAFSKNLDVVLIDTAGRMHSNVNLVDEMKKIVRVAKPDLKIFIGESITGNDCVEQAKQFNSAIGIDGIILAKADIDEKGGAAISVSHVTDRPILFMGTGQTYSDLEKFDSEKIMQNIGLA